MKSMPIRLRLTILNCLIFGTILAIVVTVIYYSHKESHYKEVDKMITNISSHVLEDINQQLDEGKSFREINLSIDSFSINEIAVMVKSDRGELINTNSHPFLQGHRFIRDTAALNNLDFQTIKGENEIRFRIKITPIYQNGILVGYIETLYSLSSLDQSIQRFKWIVIVLSVFGIVLASIAGWFLAKKTLQRVDLVGKTAKAIATSQDFEQRVLYIGPPDELGQLTETFNQMLDSLEKAYMHQKRFLSDASHELRAPLTTIRGNLDILHKMKKIPELDKEEILEDTRNEAIRMSKLVSDLLSLARADAGQNLHMDVVNLSAITKEVVTEIQSWEKDIRVDAEIKDLINIWGDRDSIKQVLLILLDNAIRYTPSNGSIFATISEENHQATIRIKDNGIGMQPEDVSLIFDRFYRTDAARKKSPDGTGLGLPIAKLIIDEHQGSIKINSKQGEGSEFIVYLPLLN